MRVLGSFRVVVDGRLVPDDAWSRRQASSLVKLLALSPRRRLHRDRVVDALWPDLTLDAALPRLHKAAHYARRALGAADAVVLKAEVVSLFPGATVEVDAEAFDAAAETALDSSPVSAERCAEALTLAGVLLPDDLGEPWADEPRGRLRLRVVSLLRAARRWDDLLQLEPADEEAHVELLREAVLGRDRTEGLRRFAGMERALASELGISPPPEAVVLRERLLTASAAPDPSTKEMSPEPVLRRSIGTTLLERDAELDEMLAAVDAAIEGRHGVIVLVAGEAGSGKSTLVRGFLERVSPAVTAYVGGCDDLLAPRTLGPFHDMAVEHPDLVSALATDRLDDVLPALLRTFAARPSVVVVEDVHWADDASLDAIRFLSRRVPGIAGALVLTFRDTGVDDEQPLRRLLGGLVGPQVRRVSLSPLTVDAVRRLGASSDTLAAEIHQVTHGNPFFVSEVLAAGGNGVPPTVRDAVMARVATLSPTVGKLVERLSVVPTRAERWLAEALADGETSGVLGAERSGIIVGGDASVAFRHELARQAVESSLTAGERLEANRLVVEALLGRTSLDSSRLLHHAERSQQLEVIYQHGPIAAREAARLGAHRQAAELLRVVLDHRDIFDAPQVARLLTDRAYSLYLVNEFDAALEVAEEGVAAAEKAGDADALADALQVLSPVDLFARGPMRARVSALRALDVVKHRGDEARLAAALTELARAHSNLATVGIVADVDERAETYAERALTMARRLRRRDIEASALCYLGMARLARGDPQGHADLERAISEAASHTEVATLVRCIGNAAHAAYRSGRPDDAERFVAAGLQASADREFFAGRYRLRLTLAAVRGSSGNWERAVSDLRELLEESGQPGIMSVLARSILARLLARRGELTEAREVLAVARDQAAGSDDTFVVGPVAAADVELGWLDGSLGYITEETRRALDITAANDHRSIQAEISAYLLRAGVDVPAPAGAPGPWAPTLAGHWQEAAAGWAHLGERYEEGIVRATAGDDGTRARGRQILKDLGAAATLVAL